MVAAARLAISSSLAPFKGYVWLNALQAGTFSQLATLFASLSAAAPCE